MKTILTCLKLMAIVGLQTVHGAALPGPPPEVADVITKWLADPTTKAPGVAVVGVNKSGILWSGAFGLADRDRKLPVTTRTRWQFASVTKVYTALMLAQLAHEGTVDLDAPITRYLPEFKPRHPEPGAPPLTLRHLATHSAGVTNWWGISTSSYTTGQLLGWMGESGLTVEPGIQFKYSNSGVAVIGAAMERASGWSYSELLRERIFKPLRLNSSGLTTVPPHPDLATSYSMQDEKLVVRPPSGTFRAQDPASSLVSTVDDVARFVHAHLTGDPNAVISEQVRDILFTPYFPFEEERGVGLGWFCSWRDNLPYWSHVGSWNGFLSRIVIRPDVGIGLAFSANGPSNGDLLIGPLLKILAAHADTSRLDAVTGDYVDAKGKVFSVHRLPGPELNLEIKDVGRLLPMTRHTFRVHKNGSGKGTDWVRFVDEGGKKVMLWETGKLVRR